MAEATPSLLLSHEIDARTRSCHHASTAQELPHPWPLHRVTAVRDITGDILFHSKLRIVGGLAASEGFYSFVHLSAVIGCG
ncbi:hypothetical protein DEO72_LG10g2366 [Vigna unguiculata]|uniref:Uncharacterized protein n=1 Tax=Vigna unguiculata TaxID=3917 RepID=A0A4D6NBC4_VIGUN|nr:hypothetical protein DEO72_LG10g2366 [Vigna unguiculata]